MRLAPKIAIILILPFLFSACFKQRSDKMPFGQDFTWNDNVQKSLQVNVTARNEILEKLGQPYRRIVDSARSREELTWYYSTEINEEFRVLMMDWALQERQTRAWKELHVVLVGGILAEEPIFKANHEVKNKIPDEPKVEEPVKPVEG